MEPSDRITWETCPVCHRPAAVGWSDRRPVEFDCPGGCRVRPDQVQALTAPQRQRGLFG